MAKRTAKVMKQPPVMGEAAKKKEEQGRARTNLSSAINAAAVIDAYSKSVFGQQQGKLEYVYEELRDSIDRIWDGDMKKCEAMLLAQASALQSIFTSLTRKAISQEYMANLDTFLRLGLKAQAQAVRTLEALAEMKNPRSVAFVKQANIANNQQVNNGQVAHAGELENQQTKLSGATYELLENSKTQSVARRVDPPLEAVGEKHGANFHGRQGEGVPKRL